jgi:hypothetical protein
MKLDVPMPDSSAYFFKRWMLSYKSLCESSIYLSVCWVYLEMYSVKCMDIEVTYVLKHFNM